MLHKNLCDTVLNNETKCYFSEELNILSISDCSSIQLVVCFFCRSANNF